jgi:type IV pilus assembly protein PilQ
MMGNMKNYIRALSVIGMMGVFFLMCTGCAANKKEQPDSFFDTWRMKAEDAKGYSPKADAPSTDAPGETQEPPAEPEDDSPVLDETPLPTVKVTLTLHDTPVAAVLRALARAANQSIMISDSVTGTANVVASGIPWDTVFLGILNTHGLVFERQGDLLAIKTPEDLDRDLQRETAQMQQEELRRRFEQTEAFETEIFFIRYGNATTMETILGGLIQNDGQSIDTLLETDTVATASTLPQASVTVDETNNAIVVHASKTKIREIDRVIQQLDRPTRQVFIEAQIVETSRDMARALGVQWGGLNYERNGNNLNWIGGPLGDFDTSLFTESIRDESTGELLYPGGDAIIHQPGIDNVVNLPGSLVDNLGMTLGYQLQDLSRNYILTTQLSALQEEGKLNILSTPSITTLDNQTASIESGREVPFQSIENIGGSIVTEIEFKKAVLSLEVTPHIINEETLRLNVATHKDELDFANSVAGNPTIITKNAETNVILFNGQTMVIGGLNKETATDSEAGVPFLKDIPLLGHLFRSSGKSSNMEEVLIFITPHILQERPETDDPDPSGDPAAGLQE